MPAPVPITPVNHLQSIDNKLTQIEADLAALGGLVPVAFDEIAMSYTGSLLTTVVYKQAGSTVATLTLGYTGSLLTSVVRS